MKNLKINKLDLNGLTPATKQVIFDLVYPVGSYIYIDNLDFDTVEKVEAYYGGHWEKITDRVLYGVLNNAGQDVGENNQIVPIPNHSHKLLNSNLHFNNVWGQVGRIRSEGNHDLSCQGVCYPDNANISGVDNDYWDSPDNDWALRGFAFSFTPSVNEGLNPRTENTGTANATIDVRGARRTTYIYHRLPVQNS